jgi:putative endonuclease
MEVHKDNRISLGRSGEDAAVRYLKKKRYEILDRGFRWLRGELDIIARDGRTVVFIEVKTRRGLGFGPPSASVTAAKRRQVRRIAECYLARKGFGREFCRFDVISVLAEGDGTARVEHLKNAF